MKSGYQVYTDGSCIGNPGVGGRAAVIKHQHTGEETILKGSESHTTNNRMELMAAIQALRHFETHDRNTVIEMFVDSKYVYDGMTSYLDKWVLNNWIGYTKKPVLNQDLWIHLEQLRKKLTIQRHRVKAHATDPTNNHVDLVARTEAEKRAKNLS